MKSERLRELAKNTVKVGFCGWIGTCSVVAAYRQTTEKAIAKPAIETKADHLFQARGLIECEGNVAVTGVWVESIPDSGWAKVAEVGLTNVYKYLKSTNDPLYTVHVGCGGNAENWAQTDYSHLVAVGGPNDFLCFAKPNTDHISRARCESDPALNADL
ncbi:MAG: hypothetical protein ABSB12_02515 [Candidatus Saccharimonadales bacterium]|jgi:hypothetical protein